jgi:hypothetical protein
MTNNDLLVWKNKPSNPIWYMKNWCKMDVILKYNMYDKIFNESVEDCWGGALVIRKNENPDDPYGEELWEDVDLKISAERFNDTPYTITIII